MDGQRQVTSESCLCDRNVGILAFYPFQFPLPSPPLLDALRFQILFDLQNVAVVAQTLPQFDAAVRCSITPMWYDPPLPSPTSPPCFFSPRRKNIRAKGTRAGGFSGTQHCPIWQAWMDAHARSDRRSRNGVGGLPSTGNEIFTFRCSPGRRGVRLGLAVEDVYLRGEMAR